ncbi:MAG: SH3 domain-containing protein [Anaerolineae bacterium]|nr:SH3 domain-containing protein [Anaerolineae bacterium]
MAKQKKSTRRQAKRRSNTNRNILIVVAILVVIALVLALFLSIGNRTSRTVQTLAPVNLHEGPGTSYPVVGTLPAGSEVTAVGRNEDGSWLQVETESGDLAWLAANPEAVKINGDGSALSVVEAPPLAYDAGQPKVNEVLTQIPLVVHHANANTCASHAGLNNLLPEVVEGNVIGPHSGDFVFRGDNVLFKYTGGSFQLIYENPVARFENGTESLPFAQAMQYFASGDIVWTGSFGEWPGRGVTGCDLSANP